MRRPLLWMLALMMGSVCQAEDITIRYNGAMPSVPSNEDAKQPTALLLGLNIVKNEPVYIYDGNGKLIDTVTILITVYGTCGFLIVYFKTASIVILSHKHLL